MFLNAWHLHGIWFIITAVRSCADFELNNKSPELVATGKLSALSSIGLSDIASFQPFTYLLAKIQNGLSGVRLHHLLCYTAKSRPGSNSLLGTFSYSSPRKRWIENWLFWAVQLPDLFKQSRSFAFPNHWGLLYYFVSIQFWPAWISTIKGTLNSTADSIVSRILGCNSSQTSGRTSKTNSSWTCNNKRAFSW